MSDLDTTTTVEKTPRQTVRFPHIFVVLFTFICIAALSTYLVDADRRIARVWNKVKVKGHAQDVLDAARAL